MNEDEENEEEMLLCSFCFGSGEGMHDGSNCQECKGTGEDQRKIFNSQDWLDYANHLEQEIAGLKDRNERLTENFDKLKKLIIADLKEYKERLIENFDKGE